MDDALILWLMNPKAPGLPGLEAFLRRPEWHRDAACRGQGTDAFIRSPNARYEAASPECGERGVREPCLAYALNDESVVGRWAASTSERGGSYARPAGRRREAYPLLPRVAS